MSLVGKNLAEGWDRTLPLLAALETASVDAAAVAAELWRAKTKGCRHGSVGNKILE